MQHIVPLFQNHILLVAFLNLFLGQVSLPIHVTPTLLAGSALLGHTATDGGSILAASGPDDEIVIYCDCPNEASAAIAAKHLKQEGFRKIRPLLGGLDLGCAPAIRCSGPISTATRRA
jgi:rhodanese-related sulfurtransferase